MLDNGLRAQLGFSVQVSEKREPQNTACDELSRVEQGIMNVEGKENFSIRNSLFDIRYSNWGELIGAWILVSSPSHMSADT
jgi:hypothetical protein